MRWKRTFGRHVKPLRTALLRACLAVLVAVTLAAFQTPAADMDIPPAGEVHPLIRLATPLPGENATSPLRVVGEARGTWYFEADFPVRLFGPDGRELAVAVAQAQGPWMTEDFVPFEAELTFDAPADACLVLVLEKSNPSDMRELDDEVRVGLWCDLEK